MYASNYSPAIYGLIVEKCRLFNLCMVTGQGKGKIKIKIWLCKPLPLRAKTHEKGLNPPLLGQKTR